MRVGPGGPRQAQGSAAPRVGVAGGDSRAPGSWLAERAWALTGPDVGARGWLPQKQASQQGVTCSQKADGTGGGCSEGAWCSEP